MNDGDSLNCIAASLRAPKDDDAEQPGDEVWIAPIETIPELIERLDRTKRPDTFLDREIWYLTGLANRPPVGSVHPFHPKFTGSVDAAITLAGKVLPGWSVDVGLVPDNTAWASAAVWKWGHPFEEPEDNPYRDWHPIAPIALCLVILKAVRDQRGEPDAV